MNGRNPHAQKRPARGRRRLLAHAGVHWRFLAAGTRFEARARPLFGNVSCRASAVCRGTGFGLRRALPPNPHSALSGARPSHLVEGTPAKPSSATFAMGRLRERPVQASSLRRCDSGACCSRATSRMNARTSASCAQSAIFAASSLGSTAALGCTACWTSAAVLG